MLADTWNHIEYATTADIDEAVRLAKTPAGSPYDLLAIRGLVAGKRWQEAFDVVSSHEPNKRAGVFLELTRGLVKAGQVEKAFDLAKQLSPPIHTGLIVLETVKTLAEMGKIEDTLPSIRAASDQPSSISADMLMAVGSAYAKRGDQKNAEELFDRAQKVLEAGHAFVTVSASAMELRFARLSLRALRGDTKAVNEGLKQLPPPSANPADRIIEIYRDRGYQRLLHALLDANKSRFALDLAKSTPDSGRAMNLAIVASEDASHGRLDEARTALSLLGDKEDPRARVAAVRSIAVASARTGDLAAAIGMASQVSDPTGRRADLFAIAQTLPR